MTEGKKKKESGEISRRKFLKDAGLVVGGTAIGSTVLLAACAGETETETLTKTVTSTAPGTTATTTKTVTVEVPVEVPKSGVVLHDSSPSACAGCMICNLICSSMHQGVFSKSLSGIHIVQDRFNMNFTAEICRQCVAPSCMAACLVEGAMYVDENTGARCIDQEKCIGCGDCAEACPFNDEGHIIKYNPETNKYFKCDLCLGDPLCVKHCPRGALSYVAREAR